MPRPWPPASPVVASPRASTSSHILFGYTPYLSGDWLIGIEITIFAAFGIYALAAGFEGHAEHPIPHWLRPPIFLTGAFLIWPTGRPSQIAAIVVLMALLALAAKLAPERKKKRVAKEATQGG